MNKIQTQRKLKLINDATYALVVALNNKGVLPKLQDNCIILPHTSFTVNETNASRCVGASIITAIALIKENTAKAVESGLEPLPEQYRTSGKHQFATWQGKQMQKTELRSQAGAYVPTRVTNVIDSGF